MNKSSPYGHKFTFTIFDDTDWASVNNVKPVYDLLADLGMRTTKSVWVFKGEETPTNEGMTCEDGEYLEWVHILQQQGFEIGMHNASSATSHREKTYRALVRFKKLFGDHKIVHCNHFGCLENIYWGQARLTPSWRRTLYNILTRGRRRKISRGHIEGDPLFWGDLCQEKVSYVRNFVFDNLNTLAICPEMPYHDPTKPFVNFWFASADGASLSNFLKNFTWSNLDRLAEEEGMCIAYVHFAGGFVSNGRVNSEFRKRLEYIASKDGWFAPVSEVLDYLRNGGNQENRIISQARLGQIETHWLVNKMLTGTS